MNFGSISELRMRCPAEGEVPGGGTVWIQFVTCDQCCRRIQAIICGFQETAVIECKFLYVVLEKLDLARA